LQANCRKNKASASKSAARNSGAARTRDPTWVGFISRSRSVREMSPSLSSTSGNWAQPMTCRWAASRPLIRLLHQRNNRRERRMNKYDSLPKHPDQTGGVSPTCVTRETPSHATRRQCLSRPAGYTLLETLVTLSLLSTLAIGSVAILNSLTKHGIESAHGRQSRRDVHRIANSLREDSTRTSKLITGKLTWPVTLPHETSQTVYDWNESESSLTRIEAVGQETVRSERFLLPKGSTPEMTAANARLTLRVNLPGEDNSWIIEGNLKEGVPEQ
jgi:hypothetical protein